MLELKNIHISFNKKSENKIDALKDINLVFNEHEWTYIIGGNGSGKSTLLKIINKELIPDKGDLIFNSYKSSDVLFIDQTTIKNLVPSMTIYENLIFALKNNGMNPNLRMFQNKNYKEIIIEKLKEFNIGLEMRINEQVKFLSGGEQQIIVASRIMLSNPRILLMDEFTSSLDQKWAPFILEKLKKYITLNNIMVLAVTHDFSQIQNIGDRIIMLRNGQVYADKKKGNYDFTPQTILGLFYDTQQFNIITPAQ